jgi:hypothetical protein
MAMCSRRFWLAAIGCAALAGCNTAQTHIGDEDAAVGEAVKYDIAIQTVNPAPVYGPDSALPGSNGDVGAAAVKRYRTDKVKQPQAQNPSSNMNGSSGGGGGPQ